MSFIKYFVAECKRLLSNPDIRLMALGAPVLYGVVLCFAYLHGRVHNVPVAVVNQDNSAFTRELLRQIDATEEVQLESSYVTLPDAGIAMAKGKSVATLYVPRNFTQKRLRLQQSPLYLATNTSNFAVSNPSMVGASTVTQVYGAGTLMTVLRKAGLPSGKAMVMANPVALDTRTLFNPLLNYSYFFVPGLIYAILQQIIIVGLCFSLTDEKDRERWQPPKKRSEILPFIFGRSLPYAILNLAFSLLFIYGLLPWIQIPALPSQFPLIFALSLFFTTAVALMAFLFGLIFKDSVTAFVALMFYSMPAFLISGMSWPSYNLPWPLQILSWLTPITHFGHAIRRVMLEPQVGFNHVWGTFLSLTFFSLIVVGICYIMMRRSPRI
ncbi:ABC transporter permease [Bdellovibrio bacteriovorus]|uniref:ABC transporter permease n=1 Tax=Bdellovibrio bacteriovorus TaxID=959 RepID=UPI0035A60DBA